jgi:hypothetical protein
LEPLQPEAFLPLAGSFVNDRMDGGTDPFDTVVKVYQLGRVPAGDSINPSLSARREETEAGNFAWTLRVVAAREF